MQRNDTLYNSCFEDGSHTMMCYTRVSADEKIRNSGDAKWGYCTSDCNGQLPGPNSTFNLARPEFDDVWEENFFDLRNFGSGYCYTYNPPELTEVGFNNHATWEKPVRPTVGRLFDWVLSLFK